MPNKLLKLPNDRSGWGKRSRSNCLLCSFSSFFPPPALRNRLHLLSCSLLVMCQRDALLNLPDRGRAGKTGQRAEGDWGGFGGLSEEITSLATDGRSSPCTPSEDTQTSQSQMWACPTTALHLIHRLDIGCVTVLQEEEKRKMVVMLVHLRM